jgi:transposase
MNETLTVQSERVDDIPLLVAQQVRMGVPDLLDAFFPSHGNREGLSPGWLTTLWLCYVLSEADHRLSHVRHWAQQRLETLRQCSGQGVAELDFTDDRLADVLTMLSEDRAWQGFEGALNQNLLRVYELCPQRVRVDSTTASGYWTVSEEGLLQLGHSKDHRPDLPQVKVMVSSLDPLGMPLVTQVVSGERADDPLYVPAIEQVRKGLGRRGLLYIGDSKMGALETRAFIHAGGDAYLCPLGKKQLPPEVLDSYLQPVWSQEQRLTPVHRLGEDGSSEQIAEGFVLSQELSAEVAGQVVSWTERRLVIRSFWLRETGQRGLRLRLNKTQSELATLTERKRGRRRFHDLATLRQAAEAILGRYEVTDLLRLDCQEIIHERAVRAYGQRPAGLQQEKELRLQVCVDEQAVQAAERALGWRVYATDARDEVLPLAEATLAYRSEYVIERGFGRLKNKPLSLTPMYLRTDERVEGLVRLLTIGLRVLTLLEFEVRQRLAQEGARLAGLYADSPKHATPRPTAERLLETFKDITLTTVHLAGQIHRHLTPLSELQTRILALLSFPVDIYANLAVISPQSP